jgi:hypothetical protein
MPFGTLQVPLGSGVDGSLRRIDTASDIQGNAYLFTISVDTAGIAIMIQPQNWDMSQFASFRCS